MRQKRTRVRTPAAIAAAVIAIAAGGRAGRADGTILQGGATIETGTGTPQGTVTITPCATPAAAPAVPAPDDPGPIGAIDGSMPAFPGGGTGALLAFNAVADASAAGGSFDYTTYTIARNVVVTYSSAVTIRTTGDVVIEGTIRTTVVGASVTILCGGNITFTAHAGGAVIDGVSATRGDFIVLDANGSFTTGSPDGTTGLIQANSGQVRVLSHGGQGISLDGISFFGALGGVEMFSASGIRVPVAAFVTGDPVEIRAFGGDVTATDVQVSGSEVRLQASGTVSLGGGSIRGRGTLDVAGIAGDVILDSVDVLDFSGDEAKPPSDPKAALGGFDLTVRAGRDVVVRNGTVLEHGDAAATGSDGGIVLTAFGGQIQLDPIGTASASVVRHLFTGPVELRAQGGVSVRQTAQVTAAGGDVVVHAGSEVVIGETVRVRAVNGSLDVRGGDSVTALGAGAIVPSRPLAGGDTARVSAGSSGASLDMDLAGSAAGLTLLAQGPVSLRGAYSAGGAVRVVSTAGGVDVAGATVETLASAPGPSGSLTIESFAPGATIDATNATIRTGPGSPASQPSGDVALIVHGPGPAPVVIDGYFLPRKLRLKPVSAAPGTSSLRASGFFDSGSTAAVLSGAATLTVGDLDFAADLVRDAKGRYRQKTEAFDFAVVPSRVNSSRARFRLKARGDFGAIVAAAGEGPLCLRFARAPVDGAGTVSLGAGRYALGRKRGALVAPSLVPLRAKAKLAGAGEDALVLLAGLATNGVTPPAAPDVTVAFGPAFRITVPGAAFGPPVRDVFRARDPAPGVSMVTLDYLREIVTVKASGVDLGTLAPGDATPVDVSLSLGTEVRTVKVRLGRKGAKLAY